MTTKKLGKYLQGTQILILSQQNNGRCGESYLFNEAEIYVVFVSHSMILFKIIYHILMKSMYLLLITNKYF